MFVQVQAAPSVFHLDKQTDFIVNSNKLMKPVSMLKKKIFSHYTANYEIDTFIHKMIIFINSVARI